MKRTIVATAALVALMFVAGFFFTRTPAQGQGQKMLKSSGVWFTPSNHRIERFWVGGACILIVTRAGAGDDGPLSVAPCG